MLLITFAHKAEAREFIKRKHNIPVEFYFPGLYRHENEILLLTGMGLNPGVEKIQRVLDYFGTKITQILNLGIAGALDKTLQINQIYGIGNIFLEGSDITFSTTNLRPQINCISVEKPVTNDDHAQRLATIAQSVDMELWGCAQVGSRYEIPVKSYKLISDYAGNETSLTEIIKHTPVYSRHLFDFYKKLPDSG